MPLNPPLPPRYESTTPPPSIVLPADNGSIASPRLGRRSNDAVLNAAFNRPSDAPVGDALLAVAKALMENYSGENPMFPQYRRNFEPQATAGGSLGPEYVAVRDKTTVLAVDGTGLGTAYSPTIASPGVANGVSPANLQSVAGNSSAVLIEAASNTGPNPLYNPSNEAHTNRSSEGTTDVGTVRRFKLGIASSTVTSLDPITNRGQFPNQPVGSAVGNPT